MGPTEVVRAGVLNYTQTPANRLTSRMDSSHSMLLRDDTEFSGTEDQGLLSVGVRLLWIDNTLDLCNILLSKSRLAADLQIQHNVECYKKFICRKYSKRNHRQGSIIKRRRKGKKELRILPFGSLGSTMVVGKNQCLKQQKGSEESSRFISQDRLVWSESTSYAQCKKHWKTLVTGTRETNSHPIP